MTEIRDRDNIEARVWPVALWAGLSLLWGAVWFFSAIYLKSTLICFIFSYGHVVIPQWMPWAFTGAIPLSAFLVWLFNFLMQRDKDVSAVLFLLCGIVFGLCISAYYVLSTPLPGPEFISGSWYNVFRIIDTDSFSRISFFFSLIPGLILNFFLLRQNIGSIRPHKPALVIYAWAGAVLPGYILCTFWAASAGLILTAALANYFTISSIRKQQILDSRTHTAES